MYYYSNLIAKNISYFFFAKIKIEGPKNILESGFWEIFSNFKRRARGIIFFKVWFLKFETESISIISKPDFSRAEIIFFGWWLTKVILFSLMLSWLLFSTGDKSDKYLKLNIKKAFNTARK